MAKTPTEFPAIPKYGFSDCDELEAWFDALPERTCAPFAVSIAVRVANRLLPALDQVKASADDYLSYEMFFHALRANCVSRVAGLWPNWETKIAANAAATATDNSASFIRAFAGAFAAADAAAYAAARGVISAETTEIAHFASSAVTVPDGEIWWSVTKDVEKLVGGMSAEKLLGSPLWDANTPILFNLERAVFNGYLAKLGTDWLIWKDWYDSVVDGRPAFNLPPDLAKDLSLRIALGGNTETYKKEFWTRDPDTITAEITSWLKEARLTAALTPPPQGAGLQYGLVDKIIKMVRGFGLSKNDDDQQRIKSQMPILLKLVKRLEKNLSTSEMPRQSLVDSLTDLRVTLERTLLSDIGVAELFGQTLIFRDELNEAQNPGPGVNIYPLSGSDLASAKSIVTISDLIVLATEEGQKLFDDAERSDLDADEFERYRKLELELLDDIIDNIAEFGAIMDADEIKDLKRILLAGNRGPTPSRARYFASSSMRNFTMTISGTYLAATLITVAPVSSDVLLGLLANWLIRPVANEAVKKSTAGEIFAELLRLQINAGTRPLLKKLEPKLRKIAENRRGSEALIAMLDRIRDEESKKK